MRCGIVADTHGHLGSDVAAALRGCDHIIHAGDIGPGVLGPLRALAPVSAVRGNVDTAGPEADLPDELTITLAGHAVTVVHRLADAPPAGWEVLVFGHCHRQHADFEGGRLALNPGAAGRRGFHRFRSVAILDLAAGRAPRVAFADLGPRRAAPVAPSRPVAAGAARR